MFSIQCPKCRHMGSVHDQARLSKAVRCPNCRTVFVPTSTDGREDASNADSPTPGDSQAKPWYQDPILQFAVAFPLIAALAMGAYILRERSRARFQQEMVALRETADRAQNSGKLRDAYDMYARLVVESQGSSDERVVEVARQAKIEQDKLLPKVKAQIDREEAERKRKEEEAHQLAALKAQQAAEAKARVDAEQRRKAEEARLAQFTVDLKGGAWVIKGGGQSDILRGLNIYIIKREVLKADLNEILVEIQKDPDFSKMGAYIRDLPSNPDDTAVNLEQLYKAIRFADLSESDNIKMIRLQYDTVWPRIIKKALVTEVITNIDGKYEVKDLKGGHYLLYSHSITRFSAIEWLIALKIEKSGDVERDLFNGTATEILNKSD